MSERKISLDVVNVATPCHEDWDKMQGDSRKRFCDSCAKHVHNLSAMTRDQAESFINDNPTGVCIQFSRDHHGRVITSDCQSTQIRPTAPRRRAAFTWLSSLGVVGGIASAAIGWLWFINRNQPPVQGDICVTPAGSAPAGRTTPPPAGPDEQAQPPDTPDVPVLLRGDIAIEQPQPPVIGFIGVPQPQPDPEPEPQPDQPQPDHPALVPTEQLEPPVWTTRGGICLTPLEQPQAPAEEIDDAQPIAE